MPSSDTRFKNGHKCLFKHTKESAKKTSDKLKGHLVKRETRIKISNSLKGNKTKLWKGGISTINKKIRQGIEFRLWREAVFARDNWTCQICKKRGVKLHPHHIKPFAFYPELRFAIDNGATLCESCHKKTDSYAGKANKKYEYKVQQTKNLFNSVRV